ncbi:TetR/AcrR family transcriptional regulator [Micromonospora mangrovi]|uniref:TetR/AcrR family transcriptional regulator n=2 Tax=Micromonospora TaxID=1873 RepID=A0AAU7MFW8_9ACTN
MGRPRAFDETEVIRAAASLFAGRAYDGISVDDLVTHLGVHRNSLYKVFGSKRGLYLAALRWHLEHQVRPLLAEVTGAPDRTRALREMVVAATTGPDLDLLVLAMAERAPVDPEVAEEVARAMRDFDAVIEPALSDHVAPADDPPSALAHALTAALLGLRLRLRTGVDEAGASTALFDRLFHSQP